MGVVVGFRCRTDSIILLLNERRETSPTPFPFASRPLRGVIGHELVPLKSSKYMQIEENAGIFAVMFETHFDSKIRKCHKPDPMSRKILKDLQIEKLLIVCA